METITKEDLETLRFQLFADLKKLLGKQDEPKTDSKEWLRSSHVKKMLSISDAALQNYASEESCILSKSRVYITTKQKN